MGSPRSPLCGDFYQSLVPGGGASAFLILSEDLWNERVSDSVVVPVFESDETPSMLRPELGPGLIADCTLVRNVPHDLLGARLGACPKDPWTRIRIGIRIHLDIDSRIRKESPSATGVIRTKWWPHQNEIRFARRTETSQDKMFGVITNDQWNSRVKTTYCSAVRLTSKSKEWRKPWEVNVFGGWVVCGDIYVLRYEAMEQSPPATSYPDRLSLNESADVAENQRKTLNLK